MIQGRSILSPPIPYPIIYPRLPLIPAATTVLLKCLKGCSRCLMCPWKISHHSRWTDDFSYEFCSPKIQKCRHNWWLFLFNTMWTCPRLLAPTNQVFPITSTSPWRSQVIKLPCSPSLQRNIWLPLTPSSVPTHYLA